MTSEQEAADRAALELLSDPAIKAARDQAFALWSASAVAKSDDARKALDGAIDETVFAALRTVAGSDAANPKGLWIEAPPYAWGDVKVPGTRFAGDSPDRIYRYAALSAAHRYQITGRRNALPSLGEFTFEAHANGQPKAVLTSKDIDVSAGGTFTITADSTPLTESAII